MGCPSVRGDNPRALASGLSDIQVDKQGITINTTYISVDLARHAIFRAKVGKGAVKSLNNAYHFQNVSLFHVSTVANC